MLPIAVGCAGAFSLGVDNIYEAKYRPAAVEQQPAFITEYVVYVTGHVVKPGVYTIPVDSHVIDAVNAAGGLRPKADIESINLAAHVSDCMQIIVHEQKQPPSPSR